MAAQTALVKVFTSFMDGMTPVDAGIEVSITPGLPSFDVIGLCDSSIRESRGRIQSALAASGYKMPKGHITASISPSYIKKSGTGFDLPIALAMLIASGQIHVPRGVRIYSTGEIMLDGTVKGTPAASLRLRMNPDEYDMVFIPEEEADAARCANLKCMTLNNLSQLLDVFEEEGYSPVSYSVDDIDKSEEELPDFSSVKGQQKAIRALLIAAAGVHNILLLQDDGRKDTCRYTAAT